MAKMSKTQRNVILGRSEAPASRGYIFGFRSTIAAMIREGWAIPIPGYGWRSAYVTSQGVREADPELLDTLHDEAQTLDYWITYPHTYAEHLKFGTLPVQREALVVSGEVGRAHGDALIENALRRPHMVQAMAIGAAERARAAGTACYHPRSCSECDSRGNACGAHRKGDAGHESCSDAAPTRDRDDEQYPDVSRDDAHGWALMESLDLDGTFRRFPAIEAAVAHVLLGGAGAIGWNQRRFAECDNAGCDSVHYCPAYGPR